MKKQIVILAILALALIHCRSQQRSGYGYYGAYSSTPYYSNSSSYYNTAGNTKNTQTYQPSYIYNPYSYYSTPYYYNPYTYYYSPYYYSPSYYRPYTWPGYGSHCSADLSVEDDEESKLNFAFESSEGGEERNVSGENLRAETFGERIEVQYGNDQEKLNFLVESGKTFVSGKLPVNGKLVNINTQNQTCNSTELEKTSEYKVVRFDCIDSSTMKINAEVLIPSKQQHSADIRTTALLD